LKLPPDIERVMKCLSRMKGNFHVRFLEGLRPVTVSGYSAHWAKRRHPEKSKHWIVDKYWQTKGNRKWVFSTDKNELKHLSDTKIVRHTQLRLEMNPYLDKDYCLVKCQLESNNRDE
jgi:hypothetical protein